MRAHSIIHYTLPSSQLAHSRTVKVTQALWVCTTHQQSIRLKWTFMYRLLHVKYCFSYSSCFVLSCNLLQIMRFSQQCGRAFHSDNEDEDSTLPQYTGIWLPTDVAPYARRTELIINSTQVVFTNKKLQISSCTATDSVSYPARSRWGMYLRYCSKRDAAWT
jgi:hypothetical protein